MFDVDNKPMSSYYSDLIDEFARKLQFEINKLSNFQTFWNLYMFCKYINRNNKDFNLRQLALTRYWLKKIPTGWCTFCKWSMYNTVFPFSVFNDNTFVFDLSTCQCYKYFVEFDRKGKKLLWKNRDSLLYPGIRYLEVRKYPDNS